MKAFCKLAFCCLAAVAHFVAAQTGSSQKPLPDVYLVTIDTLRADHLHCYGYTQIQTPAMDALAREGFRFTKAFTPSPITNTSHTSILTGLLPSAHGVTDFAIPLAKTHPTWAELLKGRGYHTAAFIGAVILDSNTLAPGLDRGFDFYDNFPKHAPPQTHWGRVERRGMDVVQRAEAWLNTHPKGPHFVWIHLYDPHDPYEPPPPFAKVYKDRLYDGEIAYADSAFGKFVTYLKDRGWYQNAMIVVVGDHGEGLGEHGEETHGIFLYDSTTHVPLIIKIPGHIPGKTVESQVRTTDLLPTTLDVLDISSAARFDGDSLKPYFGGKDTSNRVVFGETDYPLRFGWAPLRSVRADGFKFIEAPRPELYDLRTDPNELKNNYEPWAATVQKFRQQLADLRTHNSPSHAPVGAVGTDTLNELRALGYLGPGDARSATNVPEPSLLPDPKDKIEEQNLLHTAMMAVDEGRLSEARPALERVLQLDPKSPMTLRQLGELELRASNYAKAAVYLKQAREVRPEDSTAAFYEAQALEKTGDLVGARDALDASLKLTPGQFDARLLLGQVYLGLKDYNSASDQFEAALLLQPENVEAQFGLAKGLIGNRHFKDAQQQLEPLLKSQPRNPEVFELMAEAYQGMGNKDEAERAETRAKALAATGDTFDTPKKKRRPHSINKY